MATRIRILAGCFAIGVIAAMTGTIAHAIPLSVPTLAASVSVAAPAVTRLGRLPRRWPPRGRRTVVSRARPYRQQQAITPRAKQPARIRIALAYPAPSR